MATSGTFSCSVCGHSEKVPGLDVPSSCPNCGAVRCRVCYKEVPQEHKYCLRCSHPTGCVECGAELTLGGSFCPRCGTSTRQLRADADQLRDKYSDFSLGSIRGRSPQSKTTAPVHDPGNKGREPVSKTEKGAASGGETYRARVLAVSRGNGECIVGHDRIVFRWDIAGYGVEQLPLMRVRSVRFIPDYGRTMFKEGMPTVAIDTVTKRWEWVLHTEKAKELVQRIQGAMLPF